MMRPSRLWAPPPKSDGMEEALLLSLRWTALMDSYVGIPVCLGMVGNGKDSRIDSTLGADTIFGWVYTQSVDECVVGWVCIITND